MKILGCWYSNNHINKKIIDSSLASIKRAKESSNYAKVEIVTCNASKVIGNPFKEYITRYPMGVHMGIILQVLRILYEEEKAKNQYDAVCFLEHDVLYPHNYFDRVATFFKPGIQVVSNMDYIGMNETGWLDVTCRQEPMHELSFEYNYTMKHFDGLIRQAVLEGNVMLEGDKPNKIQIRFEGKTPSCHINHSKHFTSHYNCYAKKSNGKLIHSYWGDYKKYYPDNEKSAQ